MGLAYEDVYFKTADGLTLNAWFLKNPKATSTLIFAHGNAGNISDRLLKVRFFYNLGLNVFIFDYRGYGNSEGKPTENGIYLDAQAAYDYLQSRGDLNMKNIVAYGASLGGVVAIDLATHRPIAALVVESTITSAPDMARKLYPFIPSVLMSIKFNSLFKVKTITIPKLFMHSPQDTVVPFAMGQRLFAAAHEPKEFLQISGGHNDAQIAIDPNASLEFVRFLKSKGLL
jgi:fermentation-respiration switch protein FrsA (DUF1100 family)